MHRNPIVVGQAVDAGPDGPEAAACIVAELNQALVEDRGVAIKPDTEDSLQFARFGDHHIELADCIVGR